MADTSPIRQRNIDLSDDLYAEFKSAAAKRRLRLRDAFREAIVRWIEGEPVAAGADPTSGLPDERRELALDLIAMCRENAPELIAFSTLVNAWKQTRRLRNHGAG